MHEPPFRKGDRIRLVRMVDDPHPVPPGTTGTIAFDPTYFDNSWDVSVQWDNGRTLSLVVPPDIALKI